MTDASFCAQEERENVTNKELHSTKKEEYYVPTMVRIGRERRGEKSNLNDRCFFCAQEERENVAYIELHPTESVTTEVF